MPVNKLGIFHQQAASHELIIHDLRRSIILLYIQKRISSESSVFLTHVLCMKPVLYVITAVEPSFFYALLSLA